MSDNACRLHPSLDLVVAPFRSIRLSRPITVLSFTSKRRPRVHIAFLAAVIVHGLALAALLSASTQPHSPIENAVSPLVEISVVVPDSEPPPTIETPVPAATVPEPSTPERSTLEPSRLVPDAPQPAPIPDHPTLMTATTVDPTPVPAEPTPLEQNASMASTETTAPLTANESPQPTPPVAEQNPSPITAAPARPDPDLTLAPVVTPPVATSQVVTPPVRSTPRAPVAHSPAAKPVVQHMTVQPRTQTAFVAHGLPATHADPATQGNDADQHPDDAFHSRIRNAVQAAVRCPPAARMLNQSGKAGVAFDYRDGAVNGSLQLVRSSGMPILDTAALAAVRNAHYPEAPPEMLNHILHLQVWVEEACGE